ncbi:hypothetical protein HMPREF1549_01299 [Actinomyces johnsonii F0510]|uniref:Uncharacterized protein n=1 Tax=Actinomyces johnsonii F0510 TaxID=1227262 RepID=U1PWS0_9ACTO|nr:hypothetical protein HMPREF1549_01299 [Actinomyces johnsonii F0510]
MIMRNFLLVQSWGRCLMYGRTAKCSVRFLSSRQPLLSFKVGRVT